MVEGEEGGLKVTGGREEEQHSERDQRKGGEVEEVFITVCGVHASSLTRGRC